MMSSRKSFVSLILILFLTPSLLFARVNEYQAEKALYHANRLYEDLIKKKAEPSNDDYGQVIEKYQRIISLYPGWERVELIYMLLGDLYTSNKQYEKAKEAYLEIVRSGHKKIMANIPFNPNVSAQARFKIAINYEAQGNWEEAEKHLIKLVVDYPETLTAMTAPIYRANHYYDLGNKDKAEKIYQEALKRYLVIIDKYPQSRLAYAAKSLIEQSYTKVKRWEEMATALQETIKNNAGAKAAFLELAKIYQRQNKIDQAIETFEKVIKKYPDYYEARLELGKLYNDLGKYDLALEQAENVLLAQEYNVGAIILKGYVNFYKRSYDLALKSFKRAIRLGSKSPELYNLIAIIQMKFERYEDAREALEESLDLNADVAPVHVNLGNLYMAEKKYQEAEKEYQKAISKDKTLLSAYANLASLKVSQGEFDEAISTYQQMLDVDPELHLVKYHIGEVFEFKGNYEQAIEYYKDAIKDIPTFWEAYNNLAYLYAFLGKNLEEALGLTVKADELSRNNSSVLDTRGFVYYKLKQYNKAESSLSQALELAPKHPYVSYHLGLVNMDLKNSAKAKRFFEEALKKGLSGPLAEKTKEYLKKL